MTCQFVRRAKVPFNPLNFFLLRANNKNSLRSGYDGSTRTNNFAVAPIIFSTRGFANHPGKLSTRAELRPSCAALGS